MSSETDPEIYEYPIVGTSTQVAEIQQREEIPSYFVLSGALVLVAMAVTIYYLCKSKR